MSDPTYVKAQIDANPVWAVAWWLSEIHNDAAPMGWARYIPIAEELQGRPRPEPREAYDLCRRFFGEERPNE